MLGDHLAMDLLNTQACRDGELIDYWKSGDDVLRWLARYGVVPPMQSGSIDRAELLAQAMALRALAHRLITARMEGKAARDVADLNQYLHPYLSAPHLEQGSAGQLALTRSARGDAIASLLGPVAEAVAQLLVEANFALVKQCEHPDCVLRFFDRTKAHKRRWCSMALCGNRHKAAQFRKRTNDEAK